MSADTMRADMAVLTGGFSEPVFESQGVFRRVMDAMARPGTIATLETLAAPPAPLGLAAGAIALALCDHDTPVYLTPALQRSPVAGWLSFQTGAPTVAERHDSAFAFLEAGAALPPFGLFAAGTQEYPDRSTTLVIEIAALEGGVPLTLSGPGIKQTTGFAPQGLPDLFCSHWADNRAIFPRGVDVILTAAHRLVCLPRTTIITNAEV